MSLSPIAMQIQKLESALNMQKSLKTPDLEVDVKCCKEMKKFQELLKQKDSDQALDNVLKQAYTILAQTEGSFMTGLERLQYENFASRFFFLNPPWIAANAVKDDIFDSCVHAFLRSWQGENLPAGNLRNEISVRIDSSIEIFKFLENKKLTELDLPVSCSTEELDLPRLRLKELPNIFYGEIAKRLRILTVSNNQLTTLPESIGNLYNLQMLSVESNCLSALPESIGNLTNLQYLSASFNPLITSLAGRILELPKNCTVDVRMCGFSDEEIQSIKSKITDINYRGPQVLLDDTAMSPEKRNLLLDKLEIPRSR